VVRLIVGGRGLGRVGGAAASVADLVAMRVADGVQTVGPIRRVGGIGPGRGPVGGLTGRAGEASGPQPWLPDRIVHLRAGNLSP
jgi:hypothetical protein